MAAGETLLQISDYPFSYSIVAITLLSFGFDISNNHYLFLTLAGFLGTTLLIADPGGKYVTAGLKKQLDLKINNNVNVEQRKQLIEYNLSAIETKAIKTEIDKIVSFLYFLFSLLVFVLAVGFSQNFVDVLVIKTSTGLTICDSNCIRVVGIVIPAILASFLILEAKKRKTELAERTRLAGYYRFCIDLKTPTKASKDNFGRAIERGDWGLAKWWQSQVAKEMTTQEGLQEQRTKLKIEQLVKQLEVYGTLLTLLTVASRWQNIHGISDVGNNAYIFMAPDEENRLRDIFEKSNYLISEEIFELYLKFQKTKSYKLGLFPGTNQSRSYVIADLSEMENQVKKEYEQLLKQYKEISGSDFDQNLFDSNFG